MEYSILNDGNKMPMLGYGTYKIADIDLAHRCVLDALEVGYRLIDTATLYQNEEGVGRAISECGIKRSDLFITTKLWTDVDTEDKVYKTVDSSLNMLKTDYVDLLLIHWPKNANVEVFETMAKLKEQGLVKSIGVSNFKEHHIDELIDETGIVPAVDQVELHPIFQQKELREYLKEKSIQVQAWSPLTRTQSLQLAEIIMMAAANNVTPAQLVLRWHLQNGIATIPKTTHKDRMKENFNIFNFELSDRYMNMINNFGFNERQYRDPDNHGF